MRSLTAGIEAMRQEQRDRIDAAKATAAEIEQLAAKVRSDDPAAPVEETSAEPEPEPSVSASAALVNRTVLNLVAVRASQPRMPPEPPAPGTTITAAVDVPGYTPGAPLDFGQVVTGIISRANALKTAGGGVGQGISYRRPFAEDLVVTDSSNPYWWCPLFGLPVQPD
ncbi:hypothetical protein ACWD3P_28380 [Streptomyces sp. NPDC002765]